jgi:deazaflavin-dependent oxidoreductase (nitroreductase family)
MSEAKRLPRWFRFANRAVSIVSHMGFTVGPVCVLTVQGRRTGKPRSTPVSPLDVGGRRFVVAGLPNSDWARNVRAAGHGRLSRGKRSQSVTLLEVTDSTLKERVLRAYPQEVPNGAAIFAQYGIVSSPDPEAFASAAGHVGVFEVTPAGQPGH